MLENIYSRNFFKLKPAPHKYFSSATQVQVHSSINIFHLLLRYRYTHSTKDFTLVCDYNRKIFIYLYIINNMENSKDIVKKEDSPIDDITEKTTKAVKEICNKFKFEIMRCVNCPILLECSHPKKRLDPLREEAKKVAEEIYEEEIELDDSAENTLRAQNKRDYVAKTYVEDRAFERLKDERCVFEKAEVLRTLEKFSDAGYDLTDPRSYMIINELIGNILNSGRSNKAFTSLGVLLKKETSQGPIYYENPLLKTKMMFSKLIIEATEALDRILKSDDNRKAEKDFTSHLLKALQIRESKKRKLIESIQEEENENSEDTNFKPDNSNTR